MTNIALPSERPAPDARHNTGLGAAVRHARYILGENAVTGFAFGLFLLIVLAALIIWPELILILPRLISPEFLR